MTLGGVPELPLRPALTLLVLTLVCPKFLATNLLYPLCRMLFGTLYPAYASYKAVRNKDVKAYVQWMMYWIVFALFTCVETFSDVFLSFWVPFYYEMKVVIVIWLLSPATKGSSLLYRKFVHPTLTEREREIDEYLAKMRERSYSTMLELGSKGINYALQTAIKGGGGLVNQIRKSYSLSDLTDGAQGEQHPQQQGPQGRRRVVPPPKINDHEEISDDEMDELPLGGAHRGYSPRRSASGSGRVEMYFPAVDLEVRQRGSTPASDVSHTTGRSTTALSIESTDGVDSGLEVEGEPLVRTASLSSTRTSTRVRRPPAHAPGVVTTPSGRKSITAVSEAVAEVDPWVADDSSDSDSSPSHSRTTSEQVTVLDRQSNAPEQPTVAVTENVQTLEQSLPTEQIVVENVPNPDVDGASNVVEEEQDNLQVLPEQNVKQTENVSNDDINASKSKDESSKSKVFDWWPTGDAVVVPGSIYSTVKENLDKICPLKIVEGDEASEAVEPMKLKVAAFSDLTPTEEVQHLEVTEKMKPVRVTVDIKSEQESMHVRLSMESLPTSYQAAEALDSVIPLVVETYDSESNVDSDSLASVSLPSTPSVSRSSSRLSDARAGKYNKKPAPPRPEESPQQDQDKAVKGRLVLQPGVVRNLPEAMGDTSEVFLRTPKQKRKHKNSGGIAGMIPFFNKETKEESQDKVPKAKLTNL